MTTGDLTRVAAVRPITAAHQGELADLLDREPEAQCFVSARVRFAGTDPWRLGGELLGFFEDDVLHSALYLGANLVPVGTSARSRAAFADRLRPRVRRCSSLVGPAEEVLDLWRLLEPAWGPARDVRARQPLMLIDGPPLVAPDASVRQVRSDELDALLPACVAMFTAEVGVSPTAGGASFTYRARVAEVIAEGRAFARIEGDVVVFKAEVGAVSEDVCQVQGVWVDPAYRGRGLATPGMAAVVDHARRLLAPRVTLYVNDFNTPARKAYRAVGFREIGEFATVLF